jgi:O-antigen ligase
MNLLQKTQIINLLMASIVPFLIWGPFFPDTIVSLSVLVFLYYTFKNNYFYYFKNTPFALFLLFCVITTVSSLEAEDVSLSINSSLFYFRIGVFSCLIWYLIDKDKNILKYFYYSLIACFSVLVIDGYYQFFTGFNLIGLPAYGARISSFFGDELIMGSYLSRLFPFLFALFLVKEKNKYELYFIGVLFILVDVLIYITAERSAFFFLNLSTVFIIILIKEYQKFRLITFTIAFILIVILTLTNEQLSNRMIKGPAQSMGLIKGSQTKNIFTSSHDSLIKTAFKMFLDKPVLGHGPKMFRIICKEKKYQVGIKPCSTHPHNFYVQLLAETGVLGFSFLLITFFYIFYCTYRQLKSIFLKQKRYLSDYQVCLLSGILITIWPLSPNGNFFHNWLMVVYALPIGFYLHSIYSKKKLL